MTNFEKLTTETVRREGNKGILILPVGSVEQHGPHLPLTVDSEIPIRVASVLADRMNAYVAPAIHYGARSLPQSGGSPDLAGTVRVRASILTEYVKDVVSSYVSSGFRRIVVLNGHYENEGFLFEALELCREEGTLEGVRVLALSWWSLVPDALLEKLFGGKFPGWHAEHASAIETSLMLHLRKDLVGAARVDNPTPPRPGIYFYPAEASKISNRGVLGTTTNSSAEIGRALYEEICTRLEAVMREHFSEGLR